MIPKLEDEYQDKQIKSTDKMLEEELEKKDPFKLQKSGTVFELTSSNIESLFAMPGLLFVVEKIEIFLFYH